MATESIYFHNYFGEFFIFVIILLHDNFNFNLLYSGEMKTLIQKIKTKVQKV